ncbi:hypothetical protein GCM10009676_22270 [Prauserella halophila]|uniref:Uncharacterized protein n=1 Tax=Prauserella halophila TaxID=185641 RepID=A0ABN1W8H9_9PSEU|nr:hypothetical protein [Prauserella halophila]MCP2235580.1 hypothetical protein [Prauserella halophila]
MLWLFGQIWLWLLVAFALGALAGALLTWPARSRHTTGAGSATRPTDPDAFATPARDTAPAATTTASDAATGTTTTGTATTPGTAAAGDVPTTRTTGPAAAPDLTDEAASHHSNVPAAHGRGHRRGPRTPDVEQAHSPHTDDGTENHIIGTLDETTGAGRTSGTLPPRRAWHTRNEWPDEADEWATEHDIPRSGG